MSNKEREKDKHTILIADDAEMNRTLLRAILEDKYNIVEAADGEEALAILRDKNASVSVVVTDLVMPGIDGYDMISIMDSEGFLDDIPVVVLTAMNDAESELRALELGASDVITKPFDGRKVLRRIENIVARIEIESIKSNYRILKAKQDEADRYRLLRELSRCFPKKQRSYPLFSLIRSIRARVLQQSLSSRESKILYRRAISSDLKHRTLTMLSFMKSSASECLSMFILKVKKSIITI